MNTELWSRNDLLPRSKIKTIARLEPVIPSSGMGLVVIDRDPALANYLEGILLDDQSRRFVNADAQNIRVGVHDIDEFLISFCFGQMWIDGYVL